MCGTALTGWAGPTAYQAMQMNAPSGNAEKNKLPEKVIER